MDHNMAKKAKLPWKRRVQQAFADLFATKALSVPDECSALPTTINKRNNAEVEKFYNERRVIARYALATTLKQAAEAEQKNARGELVDVLSIDENDLIPGDDYVEVRGDVSVLVKINNPARLLNREMLRGVLMTDCKFTADRADEIIKKSEKEGKPPLVLTPTVIEQ